MYFFIHLLIGFLLGILLNIIFHDARLILACAIGSVFPDLIDKPVGILLFYQTIGYGRIYCHTLIFVVLIILIGIMIYTWDKRLGIFIIAFTIGLITHQLLDKMWLELKNWFWPALGHFTNRSSPDFFLNAFWGEITNRTEWLAGGIILLLIFVYIVPSYREKYFSVEIEKRTIKHSLPLILLILAVSALILLEGFYYE